MITLHRLNGQVVGINPDLITWIDVTPDTTVSFLGGDRILVKESLDEVIERIVGYRASIRLMAGGDEAAHPSDALAERARVLRQSAQPGSIYRDPPPPPPSPVRLPESIDPVDARAVDP